MSQPARSPRHRRHIAALALGFLAAVLLSVPATGFGSGWTKPKRILTHDRPPAHSMVVDGAGHVHVATERGSTGVWYVSDASGTWSECQVSEGDDRRPSIAVDGGVVHIAFARLTDGERGIYTASSDQAGGGLGCGWALSERYAGPSSHPALAARSGVLSIAFRTGDKKLRFIKGSATSSDWTIRETIDGSCCTSPVALALTDGGAPRVAYGDGTSSKAQGLKYGVRTATGWKRATVHGGRAKHVALVLDQTPGLFGQPPSNAPHVAYVVKRQGTFHAAKGSSGVAGTWDRRSLGKSFGPLDLTHHSNLTYIVHTRGGDLRYTRASGAIWYGGSLSRSGRDGKPQLEAGRLTFSRAGDASGIYYTRQG